MPRFLINTTWSIESWFGTFGELTWGPIACGGFKFRFFIIKPPNSTDSEKTVDLNVEVIDIPHIPQEIHARISFIHPTNMELSAVGCYILKISQVNQVAPIKLNIPMYKPIETDKFILSIYLADPSYHLFPKSLLSTDQHLSRLAPYSGIERIGSTCYVICILQSLFFLPEFCRIIYRIHPNDPMILNLQRIFYHMHKQEPFCKITEFLNSLGWKQDQLKIQKDAVEFLCFLRDQIQSKINGTDQEKDLNEIFMGENRIKISSTNNSDNVVEKIEIFYEIRIQIGEYNNLIDSLRAYYSDIQLNNNNKWKSPEGNLIDAVKTIKLHRTPRVLHFHIMRTSFDDQHTIKSNNKFEFPINLNLNEFVDDPELKTEYRLAGIVVHNGGATTGHYFVYLKPYFEKKWVRFDDKDAIYVPEEEAIQKNFGGDSPDISAYMLIYYRVDALNEIFDPISLDEIPDYAKSHQNPYAPSYYNFRLILVEDIKKNFEKNVRKYISDDCLQFQISAAANYIDLYNTVSQNVAGKFRIYECNSDGIPNKFLPPVKNKKCSQIESKIIYCEQLIPNNGKIKEEFQWFRNIHIFVLLFINNNVGRLQFIDTITVLDTDTPTMLFNLVKVKGHLPSSEDFDVYIDKINTRPIKINNLRQQFQSLHVYNGNILIYSPKRYHFPDEEEPETDILSPLPNQITVDTYYISNFYSLELKIYQFYMPEEPFMIVKIPFDMEKQQFLDFIGFYSDSEYDNTTYVTSIYPCEFCGFPSLRPIQLSDCYNVRDIFMKESTMCPAYFVSHSKITDRRSLRISLTPDGINRQQLYQQFTQEDEFTPRKICEYQCLSNVEQLEFFLVINGRVKKEISMDEIIPNEYVLLLIKNKQVVNDDEIRVYLSNAIWHSKQTLEIFGDPLIAVVKKTSTVSDLEKMLEIDGNDKEIILANQDFDVFTDLDSKTTISELMQEDTKFHIVHNDIDECKFAPLIIGQGASFSAHT